MSLSINILCVYLLKLTSSLFRCIAQSWKCDSENGKFSQLLLNDHWSPKPDILKILYFFQIVETIVMKAISVQVKPRKHAPISSIPVQILAFVYLDHGKCVSSILIVL